MTDQRSRKCVFVSHCLLAQGVMAEGVVKQFPGPVRPLLEFCLENDINIMQMPCPETLCAAGGLGRSPHGKGWYEANGLRETSREIADGQADYMEALKSSGYEILGIVGVDFSPACGVSYLNRGRRIVKDQGIYVEELRAALTERNLEVPFVGFHQRWHKKFGRELAGLTDPAESTVVPTIEPEGPPPPGLRTAPGSDGE